MQVGIVAKRRNKKSDIREQTAPDSELSEGGCENEDDEPGCLGAKSPVYVLWGTPGMRLCIECYKGLIEPIKGTSCRIKIRTVTIDPEKQKERAKERARWRKRHDPNQNPSRNRNR